MRRSIIVLLTCLALLSIASAEVNTSLNVSNSPPELIQNIPDILIIADTPSLDAFDLDDYFEDLNGNDLVFTHNTLSNITVTINSENVVSFYPDIGYRGTQAMQFTVSDGSANETSNIFGVTVGTDTESPKWSKVRKNPVSVYQNYHITFSSTWTDNVELRDFIFSINQGTGWQNQTLTSLTGTSNISAFKIQISASVGTEVFWRFYATDTYDNSNVTDIQSFVVKEFDIQPGEDYDGEDGGEGDAEGGTQSGGVTYSTGTAKLDYFKQGILAENLEVNVRSIKVSMRQGMNLTRVVQLINTGNTIIKLNASLRNIGDLTSVSETNFEISPGEKYELLVEFSIPKNKMPDQYFGFLILNYGDKISIPIVINVKEFESDVIINVTLTKGSKIVKIGEGVTALIKIKNLKDIRPSSSQLYYAIKNFKGDILESTTEEINLLEVFEEERTLIAPEGAQDGEYIFYARIISEDSIDLDSDTFLIGARFKIIAILKKLFYPVTILILLIILLILYIIYKRNKKKKRLLELYLLLNQLRNLVKEEKTRDAIEIYKRIKLTYGQHVSKDFTENEPKLREELTKFSKILEKLKEESEDSKKLKTKKKAPINKIKSAIVPKPQVPIAKPIPIPPKNPVPKPQVPIAKPIPIPPKNPVPSPKSKLPITKPGPTTLK